MCTINTISSNVSLDFNSILATVCVYVSLNVSPDDEDIFKNFCGFLRPILV